MAAVLEEYVKHPSGAEMLPKILAQSCVTVLGVAGAGVSITDEDLRVPLGASDEVTIRAEVLQVTLGEGPCLAATAVSEPVSADEARMQTRWPMFHRELRAKTPFRGIASIPLRSQHRQRFGALDLYVTDPEDLTRLSLATVGVDVGDVIAALLFHAPTGDNPPMPQVPVWMGAESVAHRMNVWVAIGILIEYASFSNEDALATLRAYAFGHSQDLDQVADHLTSRRLRPEALVG